MSLRTKIIFYFGVANLIFFLGIKLFLFLKILELTHITSIIEMVCLLLSVGIFLYIFKQLIDLYKVVNDTNIYTSKLNKSLVDQSNNEMYYDGNMVGASGVLVKTVVDVLGVSKASIWLYNDKRDSINLIKSYDSDNNYLEHGMICKSDFKDYFESLERDYVIVGNDCRKHNATSCFNDVYSIPNGVKSMLDIPLWYDGQVIGVIRIESRVQRIWGDSEIVFSQILSSLYTFAYSVRETNIISKDLLEFEKFVDKAALVSKADANGLITFVNKKFEEVSGYKYKDLVGQNYNILNSGVHPKKFWGDMYKTVNVSKKIWNGIITNKKKNGDLYWVDCYIKGEFNENEELVGYMTIRYDVTDVIKALYDVNKKNTYLEYAAKILRHDMNSGINIYIPRGVSSLRRRLTPEVIKEYKLDAPMKMVEEGLEHTQRIYKGVYEFTNLVKKDAILNKEECNLKDILKKYLSNTSYGSQVLIDELPVIGVNESLFCTAIDNLIRNGLKYNDSDTKVVKIFMDNKTTLCIQDNGRGLSQDEFNQLSKPYTRKNGQKETGTGLGLNICIAILDEHGFDVSCEKNKVGTKIKIKLKK